MNNERLWNGSWVSKWPSYPVSLVVFFFRNSIIISKETSGKSKSNSKGEFTPDVLNVGFHGILGDTIQAKISNYIKPPYITQTPPHQIVNTTLLEQLNQQQNQSSVLKKTPQICAHNNWVNAQELLREYSTIIRIIPIIIR